MPGPLKRRSLPVPVNMRDEIAGLRPIETQPRELQPAMRILQERGEMPYAIGRSRETRLGIPEHVAPQNRPTTMGWTPSQGDIINVNRESPFFQQAQTDEKFMPILSSILHHENSHVDGADEPAALRKQAEFLGLVKKNPYAQKFGSIIGRIAEEGQ